MYLVATMDWYSCKVLAWRLSNTLEADFCVAALKEAKGRWIDNRMIERLWRSLKYECVYLRAFETGSQTRGDIGKWVAYYNAERPYSTHGILTLAEVHANQTEPMRMAA